MAAACTGIVCRKRPRSEPDDCEDCMPISKRINNLHIRPSTDTWDEQETRESFNNNLPGQSSCCQLSPQVSPTGAQLASFSGAMPGSVPDFSQQLGINLSPPDINHNNPLLSPLPHQPCPTNVLSPSNHSQPPVNHPSYRPVSATESDYYCHINATLFQAHQDRTNRRTDDQS